jgi:hypothetical protein
MSLYKQFKSDESLEKQGILIQYGDNSKGLPTCIRIARAGGSNVQFQKRMEAEVKPYRRQIQTETIDTKLVEKLVKKVYAETVVLGWEHVEFPVLDAEGNATGAVEELPYTPANCVRLFSDLPDLFLDLQEQAQRAALFRAEIREADAGN